jgi:hypothetical protein
MAEQKQYYVYQLIDPRTSKPFYIGKGKKDRINAHEKEARKGEIHPKCDVIREIEKDGLSVIKEEVKRFASEDAAYNFEKKLIKKIGLSNLTNLTHGGRCAYPVKPKDKELEKDKSMLDALFFLYKKTDGFKPVVFTWCGVQIPLREDFFEKMKARIAVICSVRGFDFVKNESKKYNINIRLVSKVEDYATA